MRLALPGAVMLLVSATTVGMSQSAPPTTPPVTAPITSPAPDAETDQPPVASPPVTDPDKPAEPDAPVVEPSFPDEPLEPAPVPTPVPTPAPAPAPKPRVTPKPAAPKPATPKPVVPKTPAPKPAAPLGLDLILRVPEPRIRDGKLETAIVAKRFTLDTTKVARSREYRKVSTTLDADLKRLFARLEREPRDARWVNDGGNWTAQQQSGWSVNETATRAAMLDAILKNRASASIAVNVTAPDLSVEDWAGMGIVAHFGGGTSSFAGSPSFRVQNILAGARRLDGLYLKPGEVFDFNRTIGPINAQTGFVPGYIISGGTLALDYGGGICQVSTTIFRAAYLSGLPLVERHFHSYRVHYYDPLGLEATVFAPYKNFRFRNDTGAPLYLQVSWNLRRQTLSMDLFGRAPDRRAVVSSGRVTNWQPAPGPRYTADPNVRLGRERRIDSPEPGMTVTITRSVTLNSGEVRKDTLVSHYQPWGAIYAVNPADPRVAPPAPEPAADPTVKPATPATAPDDAAPGAAPPVR